MELNKYASVLTYLRNNAGYFTSEELAIALQLNSRTIRLYVNQIRDMPSQNGFEILSSPNLGYSFQLVDEEKYNTFMATLHADNLVYSVLMKILFLNKSVTTSLLADEFFISKSSMERLLKDAIPLLEQFDLRLSSKAGKGMRVEGLELNKRMCINHIMNLCSSMDSQQKKQLEYIVVSILKKEEYDITRFNMNHLLLHLSITIYRIQQNSILNNMATFDVERENPKEFALAKQIANKVSLLYQIEFPYQEICYLSMHLVGKKRFGNILEIDNLQHIQEIVFEILRRLDQQYPFHLSQDLDLFVFLCLHIKPLIQRLKYHLYTKNPMLESIKAENHIGFEASIVAGAVIKEFTSYCITDDELGYLALHFTLAIEKSKESVERKRLLVVCASGMGTARLFKYKLAQKFTIPEDNIETVDAFHLQEVDFTKYDYLITTIPLNEVYPIPVIEIMNFSNGNQLDMIQNKIFEKENTISQYIEEDLFFVYPNIKQKEEAIRFLCDKICEKYPIQNLYEDVCYREYISATEIGNAVAIPHPMRATYEKPIVAVMILDELILWNKKQVYFIFMIITSSGDSLVNEDLSEHLTRVYLDVEGLAQLKKTPTISFLKELIEK